MALSTYTAWGHETSFYRFCQIVPEVGMTKNTSSPFYTMWHKICNVFNCDMKKPPGLNWLKHTIFNRVGESESQIMFHKLHHLPNECLPCGK